MPLLNYTTQVDPLKSVGEIHALLVRHGASSVLIEYDGQRRPSALTFSITTAYGEQAYRLPANVAGLELGIAHALDLEQQISRAVAAWAQERAER